MKLIAINTIRRGVYSSALKLSRRTQYLPGEEFDVPDSEGAELIEAGVARRKTREVIDDDLTLQPDRRKRRRKASAGVDPEAETGDDGTDDGGDDPDDGDGGDDSDAGANQDD